MGNSKLSPLIVRLGTLRPEDREAAARIVDELVTDRTTGGPGLSMSEAISVLNPLRSRRWFDLLVCIEHALSDEALAEPGVGRRLAQGLIETGDYAHSIKLLNDTLETIDQKLTTEGRGDAVSMARERFDLKAEHEEVVGLLGRAHKQRYVDATEINERVVDDANAALERYQQAYRAAPVRNLWHGINFIAMACHLGRRLPTPKVDEAQQTAREMLHTLQFLDDRRLLTLWDYATRVEAHLALDQLRQAEAALDAYLAQPELDAFAVGSTLRQFKEVWEIRGQNHPAASLVRALERRLEALTTGSSKKARVTADYSTVPITPLEATRARGVARIGEGIHYGSGTGFLFDARLICEAWASTPLILTCAHVCPGQSHAPLPPERATFIFFESPKGPVSTVIVEGAELIWTSPPDQLDATLLIINSRPTDVEPMPVAKQRAKVEDRANIIGYPLGGRRRYSHDRNRITRLVGPQIHYTTATDAGSSGSPIFDDNWQLIGMHRHAHRAQDTKGGVDIHSIIAAAKTDLGYT